MKNERLSSIFSSANYETKVMLSMMESILGDDKVEQVLADLETPSLTKEVFIEGRPLRFYSGLSDSQLDKIGLSKEGKEELYSYYEKAPKPVKDEPEEEFDEVVEMEEAKEFKTKPKN